METKNYHGIWVAKYEASSSTPNATSGGGDTVNLQVNVKPSVPSWRGITVSNIFTVCRNMTLSKGALEGITQVDSHMMKNVDWGAVVYLSQSKYGKNSQVWNNPSMSFITGSVGTSADDVSQTSTSAYNTENGPKASTTGNVYGIYDMAGGAWEYVAAHINNSYVSSNENNASLFNADSKYKDVYSVASIDSDQTNYEANKKKYGDAVYETSYQGEGHTSWQKDGSIFPYTSHPVFLRGGGYSCGTNAGLFYFDGNYENFSTYSFRPVCVAL